MYVKQQSRNRHWRTPRMYQLVRQKGTVKAATFEIDSGVEVFSFTFG